MKNVRRIFVSLIVLFLFASISCDNSLLRQNTGICVRLPSVSREATDSGVNVDKFKVTVANSFYSYPKDGKPGETIFFADVVVGTYKVTVEGYANGKAVMKGSKTAVVEENKTTSVRIKLQYIDEKSTEDDETEGYKFHTTITPCDESDNYVYFGDWPQTVLNQTSGVTVNKDVSMEYGGNTYYLGSDGNYYIEVYEKKGGINPIQYSDGTSVNYFYTSEPENNKTRYFKLEPIKWQIIKKDGKTLLVSDKILMAGISFFTGSGEYIRKISDRDVYPYEYEESEIRAYLNGISFSDMKSNQDDRHLDKGFLQSAFKKSDKILTTEVRYEGVDITSSQNRHNTNDKIFLLSNRDITDNEISPAGKTPTDFALANGALSAESGEWWLRSLTNNEGLRGLSADKVGNKSGNIGQESCTCTTAGIVPAMYVDF